MPRLVTFVGEHTLETINEKAEKNKISASKYASGLIEFALKIKSMEADPKAKKAEEKRRELELKTPEYLLRILNISSEILRCNHDPEKMKVKQADVDHALDSITAEVKTYLKGYLGEDN